MDSDWATGKPYLFINSVVVVAAQSSLAEALAAAQMVFDLRVL